VRLATAFAGLAAIVLLSGCAGNESYFGSGPLPKSPQFDESFAKYKASNPGFFAVSTDGRALGWTSCPVSSCSGNALINAIHACERSSKGVPCKIYADGPIVVWRSDQPPAAN